MVQPWPQQWRSSWEMQPPLHHRQVSHGRSGRLSAFPVCHAERQLELWRQRALPCLHLSPVLAVVMLTWTTAWRNTQPGTETTGSNLSQLKNCRAGWSTTQCLATPYLLQSRLPWPGGTPGRGAEWRLLTTATSTSRIMSRELPARRECPKLTSSSIPSTISRGFRKWLKTLREAHPISPHININRWTTSQMRLLKLPF